MEIMLESAVSQREMNYARFGNFHNKLLPKSLKSISNFVCHSQNNRIEQVIYGEAIESDAHRPLYFVKDIKCLRAHDYDNSFFDWRSGNNFIADEFFENGNRVWLPSSTEADLLYNLSALDEFVQNFVNIAR